VSLLCCDDRLIPKRLCQHFCNPILHHNTVPIRNSLCLR
jgi:hypothetical protein